MNAATILIQAAAIMLALIALRPLLKRFLSARARCALWAIPALRLLFPIELQSTFSIMAPVRPVSANMVVFKGTDDCDSMVFGSCGGYRIGDSENTNFWQIFGLDPAAKEPAA